MSEDARQIEIFDISFSVTKNGDIMSVVFIDERESFVVFSNNINNAYNNEFLSTRQKGDKILYTQVNGRATILVPKPFIDLYSSDEPTGKLMRRVYANFRTSLDKIKNGERTSLADFESINYIKDVLREKSFFYDATLQEISESDSAFYKLLSSEMNKSRASRKFDPEDIIKGLADCTHREFSKNFKIIDKLD